MLGEHQIVRKLGEGAMGAVYEAVHRLIGKRVAVKVLKGAIDGDSAVAAKRLLEEARVVNAIDHRGVVDIFDAGLLPDGRPYLVMELLIGRSLHEEVKRTKGGLPLRMVLHVLTGVLEPLVASHAAGVIHRDLKASNVFLVEQPSGLPLVKLVDFGIARREGRSEVLTMPSMTVGSMGFMAPEHINGKPVPQSDLYACGCLAWLMLTGRPVFPYGNPALLLQQHLKEVPPPVRTLRPELSVELSDFVAWLLDKEAELRPHSAEVALTVLRELAQGSEGTRTLPGGPAFIQTAKKYDARVRVESGARPQPITDLQPAFVPTGERAEAPTRARRTPAAQAAVPRAPRSEARSPEPEVPRRTTPGQARPAPPARQTSSVSRARPVSDETPAPSNEPRPSSGRLPRVLTASRRVPTAPSQDPGATTDDDTLAPHRPDGDDDDEGTVIDRKVPPR